MASFDHDGNYELRFCDHSGAKCLSTIRANDDDDALSLARSTRYPGIALEVWKQDRLIEAFPTMPRKERGMN